MSRTGGILSLAAMTPSWRRASLRTSLAYRMQSSAPEAVDHRQRVRGDEEAVRHRARRYGRLRAQMPACAATGGARSSLHPTVLGHEHRRGLGRCSHRSRGIAHEDVREDRSAHCRPPDGFESSRDCSIRPWSSGVASSAGLPSPKARTAATIIRMPSACGWRAPASKAGKCSGPATSSVCARRSPRSACMT